MKKKQAKRPATFPTAQKWTTAKDRPRAQKATEGPQKATTTKATQKARKGAQKARKAQRGTGAWVEENSFLKAFQAKVKENLKAGKKPLQGFTGEEYGRFIEIIIKRATEKATEGAR